MSTYNENWLVKKVYSFSLIILDTLVKCVVFLTKRDFDVNQKENFEFFQLDFLYLYKRKGSYGEKKRDFNILHF